MWRNKLDRIGVCGLLVIGGMWLMLLLAAPGARPAQAQPVPPQGNGGATVFTLNVGSSHACVTMSSGRLLCWGTQSASAPVLGDNSSATRYVPVDVVSITTGATSVAAGGTVTCALVNGGVRCWGGNTQGQLGTGNNTLSSVPTDVVGLASGVASVAAGVNYACAVTTGGAARCWGLNDNGQLGNNSIQPSNVPTDVVGLASGVSAIAARQNHTCAIVNGGARCWGANFSGQLGTGNTSPSQVPVQVSGLITGSNVTALSLGAAHTCALVNGAVRCWGDNTYGQLGTGNITSTNTPTDVVGLASGVAAIATGASHSCALTSGGGVKCWGRNDVGQLGISSTQSVSMPVDVQGLTSGVAAIAAGGNSASNSTTCALLNTGRIKCWGNGAALGLGFFVSSALVPRDVLGLPDECIFTTASGGDDWADPRNWSNCGGGVPQAGDNVVVGRPSTSGIVPQVYATTTFQLNRLRVIGSFNMYGSGTVNHVFDDNIATLNPNLSQNNFRFFVISPASLTVTQRLTWTLGYLDGTGNLVIQPGAVGTVQGMTGVANAVNARVRNSGVFNMNTASMATQWVNETGGVMSFTGDVYCCSTSGGVFTNRGTVYITGTNRIVPIYQYSGATHLNGVITRTTNFYAMYLYGGALNGAGVISDSVDNIGGVVAPGGAGSTGSLIIADYYRQSPTATLSIDVGGALTGTFDVLNVLNTGAETFYPGRADLSGTLTLNQLSGFTPQSGDQIRFMNFGTRTGFFGTVNNAFGPAFIPAAYSTYAALVEGSGGAVGLYAKADSASVEPGADNSFSVVFENPFTQSVTIQAITHTLPISVAYKAGSTQDGLGDPTITLTNGQQQLRWSLAKGINAVSTYTFKFGVTTSVSAALGVYTSTLRARTSAGPQELALNNAAPFRIQIPFLEATGFGTSGKVTIRPGLPPAVNLTRGQQSDWFLVTTKINCPPGRTCTDPLTDIFSVTLKIAGYAYTMTAGTAPISPTAMPASYGANNIPIGPAWADPPPYFHWEPGVPCDQQLPKERCDPGPENPYRTPDCPIPIVVVVHWSDGSTSEELIACMALYDPSGYVRNVVTSQPITNATVSLYRVPFALPDTITQTRDCRTIDTRPGGSGGNWNSLPAASLASGTLEDAALVPARIDPPVNPQATDAQGHYGWDVATGCWFVVVSAPGYLTKISPAVGVPPAVTDLDIYLTPDYANKVYLPFIRR